MDFHTYIFILFLVGVVYVGWIFVITLHKLNEVHNDLKAIKKVLKIPEEG